MRILIINQGDAGTEQQTVIESLPVTIGRGADQHVRLPDLRVALKHAEIVQEGKQFKLRSLALAGVTVGGLEVQATKLQHGMRVELGLCTLHVVKRDGYDLALRVNTDSADAQPDDAHWRGKYQIDLKETGLSPRRWALGLAASVLLLFLA